MYKYSFSILKLIFSQIFLIKKLHLSLVYVQDFGYSPFFYSPAISFDFSVQVLTASITVPLNLPSSSTLKAAIVVHPGEVTSSFKTPGCFFVSSSILAEPKTV